ncbi:kinase-like domain-containing protein [Massariosphaeria phaeospora]|uniref:Cyclin-dependent kinase 1 n=1 Tax=Massariosphaeria phaeospora TaxID=100035 RepID=A0A7C8MAY8_9PLEO|nr:kinase-like domain-containing protein [Massariosphaeria phaeospora]
MVLPVLIALCLFIVLRRRRHIPKKRHHFIDSGPERKPSLEEPVSDFHSIAAPRSNWYHHLQAKGIIRGPTEALDWSGKGQHVEYTVEDEDTVPLVSEKIIGHSATALVESVRWRGVLLARKKVRCNKQLTCYDAVKEVTHLQRLQNNHLVQVVGTYIVRNDLSILLHPVTEWNLEEFMDDTLDRLSDPDDFPGSYEHIGRVSALKTFFGCLSNAIYYIHRMNIKHMDIKPKNLLVRRTNMLEEFKVYVADFGIARSYNCPEEAETDSWTAFTRTYAAPEVVMQSKRGFNADMFSLGCVYTEMLATIFSTASCNRKAEVRSLRGDPSGDTSYQANIVAMQTWLWRIDKQAFVNAISETDRKASQMFLAELPHLLHCDPARRPTSEVMANCTKPLRCLKCDLGPELLGAAEPAAKAIS